MAYAVKIEEMEQHLGYMRTRHLMLEQREADADEQIGDVHYVMSQHGIPELSYSDSEEEDDESTFPPSDLTFSDLHLIEATDDSGSSDSCEEGTDGGSEAHRKVTSRKVAVDLSINHSSMHAPHTIAMVAKPSDGPSCGSTQWESLSKVGSTRCKV